MADFRLIRMDRTVRLRSMPETENFVSAESPSGRLVFSTLAASPWFTLYERGVSVEAPKQPPYVRQRGLTSLWLLV